MRYKKNSLTAFLPSTPCTQEMRESLIKIAVREGRSIADLQRTAIALFLSTFDKQMSDDAQLVIEGEAV